MNNKLSPKLAKDEINKFFVNSCIARVELDSTIKNLLDNEIGLGKAWYSQEAYNYSNELIKDFNDLTCEFVKHTLDVYNTLVSDYNFIASHNNAPIIENKIDDYFKGDHDKTKDLIKSFTIEDSKIFGLKSSNPNNGQEELDYQKLCFTYNNLVNQSKRAISALSNIPKELEFYEDSELVDSGFKTGIDRFIEKYRALFNKNIENLRKVIIRYI